MGQVSFWTSLRLDVHSLDIYRRLFYLGAVFASRILHSVERTLQGPSFLIFDQASLSLRAYVTTLRGNGTLNGSIYWNTASSGVLSTLGEDHPLSKLNLGGHEHSGGPLTFLGSSLHFPPCWSMLYRWGSSSKSLGSTYRTLLYVLLLTDTQSTRSPWPIRLAVFSSIALLSGPQPFQVPEIHCLRPLVHISTSFHIFYGFCTHRGLSACLILDHSFISSR